MLPVSPIVLCVEDDPDDRALLCTSINEINSTLEVHHAVNGLDAMEYLYQAKTLKALPCLVILDINMPKMDGKQTLTQMKRDVELKDVPVVIFTTSSNPLDIEFCTRLGVELIVKPNSLKNIKNEVEKLLSFCNNVND